MKNARDVLHELQRIWQRGRSPTVFSIDAFINVLTHLWESDHAFPPPTFIVGVEQSRDGSEITIDYFDDEAHDIKSITIPTSELRIT